MGRPPSADLDKFIVRLPDGMKEKLSAAAKQNNRTMTAEIVWRLDWTLSFDAQSDEDGNITTIGFPVTVEQRIDEIEITLKKIEAKLR